MGVSADEWAASTSATPVVVDSDNATASDNTAASDNTDGRRLLDLVFTMDCTGSMGSYIQAAKQNIVAITEKLATQNIDLRFGLVAYRDHPPQDQSYVSKTFDFTTSVAEMQLNLRTLQAQGGGDGPEAVEAGLQSTLEMAWRPDATKVCILVADAPPHGLGEGGDGFPEGAPTGVDPLVVIEQMSMQGICIYAVGCQPALSHYRFATDFFIAAAERTNGQAVALGSAARLADVIMGGAVEECDLQGLMAEMELQVQQVQQAAPEMAEEEVQEQVHRAMQAKGAKTRQMKAAQLRSDYSDLVTSAPSLCAAKAALSKAAPPPPQQQQASIAAFRAHAYRSGSSSSLCLARAPPPPCGPPGGEHAELMRKAKPAPPPQAAVDDRVEVEEGTISMEQVKRMYAKGKKRGAF